MYNYHLHFSLFKCEDFLHQKFCLFWPSFLFFLTFSFLLKENLEKFNLVTYLAYLFAKLSSAVTGKKYFPSHWLDPWSVSLQFSLIFSFMFFVQLSLLSWFVVFKYIRVSQWMGTNNNPWSPWYFTPGLFLMKLPSLLSIFLIFFRLACLYQSRGLSTTYIPMVRSFDNHKN